MSEKKKIVLVLVLAGVQLRPPQRCLSPSPQYLWMRPYLEMLFCDDHAKMGTLGGPGGVWCPQKMGTCGPRDRRVRREGGVKTQGGDIYRPKTAAAARSWESGPEQAAPPRVSVGANLPTRRPWPLASGQRGNTFLLLSLPGALLGCLQDWCPL